LKICGFQSLASDKMAIGFIVLRDIGQADIFDRAESGARHLICQSGGAIAP
jgi:hypothetical protein